MRIGFIGTGTMGNAMACCLLEAGHDLVVHDLKPEAAANLVAGGARWADTPRTAASGSEIVFTSLPGPSEVESVVLDPSTGIVVGLQPGSIYIDTTTNSPVLFERIVQACRAVGAEALDAPVSGRPPNMTMMVGGRSETLDRYRPVFDCMAKHIFHTGDTGTGMAAKLANQLLTWANFVAAAEALIVGAKAGVDIATLMQIIPVSSGNSRAFERFPNAILHGEFRPGPPTGVGSLDLIAKDISLAIDLARSVEAPCLSGMVVDDIMKRAQIQGLGEHASHSAVRILEQMAGVELRVPE